MPRKSKKTTQVEKLALDREALPSTSGPVIKKLYRCPKDHEELQEPDCNHLCRLCNYQAKMELVEMAK